jgi:hypothetical protein
LEFVTYSELTSKDFARICEQLNKATRKDVEYSRRSIIGKALDALKILKTMLCLEPIMQIQTEGMRQ